MSFEIKNIESTTKFSNGVEIPIFGLGTYLSKGDDCYNSVLLALKNGYIHIDTAQDYGNENQVGKAILDSKIDRKKIFITTKIFPPNFEKAYSCVEESLKNLQVDYIDCILLHAPGIPGQNLDYKSMRKKAWLDFEKLYSEGKVKSIGVSNYHGSHIEDLVSYAKIKPHMNQIELHPWNQRKSQLESCKKHGIVVEGWGPFSRGHILKDEAMIKIAEGYKKTVAQICVRWALQRGFITIPKSISEERIKSNSNVFDFEISKEDMEKINAMDKGYLSCTEHWEHDKIE
eukprot:gene10245-2664_t